MADETDGIEEALEGAVRMAVMAGARLGSEIARARQDQLRAQRLSDEREARTLVDRFEVEKRVAVAELSQVHRPDWWDRADAQRIGQSYATARAWAPEVDEAGRAEQKIRHELQTRYGIDVTHLDPRSVSGEVEAWRQRLEEQRRQDSDRQRTVAAGERTEAAVLLDRAAREDRGADAARDDERGAGIRVSAGAENPWVTATQARDGAAAFDDQTTPLSMASEGSQATEHRTLATASEARGDDYALDAERLYDSAERRDADARTMEANGVDPEIAKSRMRADTGRATHATLATTSASRSRSPKARKTVTRGAQAERAGAER